MSIITQNLPQDTSASQPALHSAFRTWWKEKEVIWWPLAIVPVGVIVFIAQHYPHLNYLVRH
jgi:hypothetical protein